jgi:2,3-bisphosphoglycerate-independent phosphoglycerate mutase
MKYIVMLGDGMADLPFEGLGNKTPLQCAKKPNIDFLAQNGKVGMVKTVPDGIAPGSDVANLSVMGYNPKQYYTGRSPLEAVSIGIELSDTDIAFRCNLVTLSDDKNYADKTMVDYSSDEITTAEAAELITCVNEHFKTAKIEFFPGISYRHCMVWHEGLQGLGLTPPHDISDKKITTHLPKNELILDMMVKSYDILKNHPINLARVKRGLHPANSIWLWGEGTRPAISKFYDKYKLDGSVISAVDLIKGIGICAGLDSIEVEGATGNISTNFAGKGQAAIEELLNKNKDFVYIHVEAPDECGHRREVENKVRAIELIDEQIVGPLIRALNDANEDYSILVMPDHPTPLALKTHTSDPVPFIIYRSTEKVDSKVTSYTEEEGAKTGLFIADGHTIMDTFLK